MKKRQIKTVLLVLLFAAPFLVTFFYQFFKLPVERISETVGFKITPGMSLSAIADSLEKRGLIEDAELFVFWITSLGKDRSIKAGYFEIPINLNYAQLATYLTEARPKEIKITIIEGSTVKEIATLFAEKLDIDAPTFISLAYDSHFIRYLGLEVESLEGYLLPDTYYFYWGMEEKRIIKFLVERCLEIFNPAVRAQIDSMNMTIHNILTMASIIEGETIIDSERAVVASVYYNRLRRRIKLQADPTIQYIIPDGPRRLLIKDLEIDSPYNTYVYYGLPPGPINNPGKASIIAAIYPEKTDYLYFVAKGDGSHTFSKTLADHNRAKADFDRIRREVYRKKRMR
jgi:UPF0755 protein